MDAEKSTRRKKPSNPKPAANQSGSGNLGKWLFEDVGPKLRGPNRKNYAWCPLHGREIDRVHSGMYMPLPHDHKEWQSSKDSKLNSRKEQKEGRAP